MRDDGKGKSKGGEPDKLFIGGLSQDTTDDDVRDIFSKVGEIDSVSIIKDRDSGESKGFGFIKFARAEDADEAFRTMNETEIRGTPCRLERPGERKSGGKGKGKGKGKGRSMSRSRSPRGDSRRRGGRSDSRSRTPPPRQQRRRRGDGGRGGHRDGPPRRRRTRQCDDDGDGFRERGRGRRRQRRAPREADDFDDDSRPRGRRRGERSASGPRGVPRKSEAIRNAQLDYEEALDIYQEARDKVDSANATLKKVEKTARQTISRKVADADKVAKTKLASEIAKMKREAEDALQDTLKEIRDNLKNELAEKIKDLKAEYDDKIEEQQAVMKKAHAKTVESDEKKLVDKADAKVEDARHEAETDANVVEWREKAEAASKKADEAEDKMDAAKKKLESLTGKPVKEPRNLRAARPEPTARKGDQRKDAPDDGECEYEYSECEYSEYSDA